MTTIPHSDVHPLPTELELIARSRSPRGSGWGYLAGWVGVVCLLVAMSIVMATPDRQRAIEATAQIEQFTKSLSHAKAIAPDTARRISEIIRQPEYDCMQIMCPPALEARNREARQKLETLLGASGMKPARDLDQIEQASAPDEE